MCAQNRFRYTDCSLLFCLRIGTEYCAGWTNHSLYKTHYLFIHISASDLHLLQCKLHSETLGSAWVLHRSMCHPRCPSWMCGFHDYLLVCRHRSDEFGCFDIALIVHIDVVPCSCMEWFRYAESWSVIVILRAKKLPKPIYRMLSVASICNKKTPYDWI